MPIEVEKLKESLISGNADTLDPSEIGIDLLWEYWQTDYSDSLLAGRYVCWIINSTSFSAKTELLVDILDSSEDVGVFVSIVEMVTHYELDTSCINEDLANKFFLIQNDNKRFHGIRGQSLLICVTLAIKSKVMLRKIRSLFFTIDLNDDHRYLRYVASAIGILSDHVQLDEAIEQIEYLKDVHGAKEEACLQLGFRHLSEGFVAANRDDAIREFNQAEKEFETSISNGEGRIDAIQFYNCVKILNNFISGNNDRIEEAVLLLQETNFEYLMLINNEEVGGRQILGCKSLESFQWMLFASRLTDLNNSLKEDLWMNATRTIEQELFFIYCVSRSIFKRDETKGLSQVLRPLICDYISKNDYQLQAVNKWLNEVNISDRDQSWHHLQNDVLSISNKKKDNELINTDIHPVLKGNPSHDEINSMFITSAAVFNQQLNSPAVGVIKENLYKFIKNHAAADWDYLNHRDAQSLFFFTLEKIIVFTRLRINIPADSNNRSKYLYKDYEHTTGTTTKEENLQDDLYSNLSLSLDSPNLNYEPRKQTGGRVDIKVSFRSVNTVIELKKIDLHYSDEKIIEKYAPQASTYQVCDANFCFLGVLDNFDSKGKQTDLRDCISFHKWSPTNNSTPYTVVLFRIQGKRVSPSTLSR